MYYTHEEMEEGSTRVHLTGAVVTSVRIVLPGEQCNCIKRRGWEIQCHREGDTFDKNKWSHRWLKHGALPQNFWDYPVELLDLELFSDANAPLLPSQFENKLEFKVDDAIEAMQQLGDDDAWTAAAIGVPALLNLAEMNSAIAMQTIASDSVTNHQPFCSTAASVTANVNALSQAQTLSNCIANQLHHSTFMSQASANGLIPGSILGSIPGSEARDFGAELPFNSILPSQPTSTS
jgi:hypothetical protein